MLFKDACEQEKLPTAPSGNLPPSKLGNPILEVTLESGDSIYLPRGYIFQASTPANSYSLHILISTYQKHTWANFISILMPAAIRLASKCDMKMREGLPVGLLRHLGGFISRNCGGVPRTTESRSIEKMAREAVAGRLIAIAEQILSGGSAVASTGKEVDSRKSKRMGANVPNASNCITASSTTCKSDAINELYSRDHVDPLLLAADLMAVGLVNDSLPPALHICKKDIHVKISVLYLQPEGYYFYLSV
ncbi:unnamed protein product [Protopolystoma xenopodis]|uniref:Bifunctional lysine-specific demethylase and histidyl-hydroxylase n=1 Tax=Protopolystoma xenopodis TaxID=117903 RepID=A0A448WTZ3_9PLAT|nr:unnamed protein product [Protopolystoma xenopodis]